MKNSCPICEVSLPGPWQEYPDYPFCSKRCRLVDLGRWLGEGYAVKAEDESLPTEE
jgi:endogenous inhibitor of DNA gyrase (YacG/DUF329 family)